MLKKLAVKELINYEPYGYVTLTPAGKKIAREIQARHIGIKDFLVRILKLDEADAEHTACRMEHAMDRETFARFMEFIDFIDNDCPRCGENWLNAYQAGTGPETPNCDLCKKKSRPGKA